MGIRSALDRLEPVAPQQSPKRPQRVEGQVLVVERVPLELLQQVTGVHHLQAEEAVGSQSDRAAARGSRRDLRCGRTRCSPVTRSAWPISSSSSSTISGPNAPVRTSRPCSRAISVMLGARSTPSGPDPALAQRGHKRAVVAAELDHGLRVETLLDPGGVVVEMLDQAGDGAGGERVVVEQDVRIDRIDDLDQAAVVAHADQQRVALLGGDLVRAAQEPPASGSEPRSRNGRTAGSPQPRQMSDTVSSLDLPSDATRRERRASG